jgi:transcriptional regulator with XRE-family HTH domain
VSAATNGDAEANALAQRLKETRSYLNLSQQYVSEQTGLARSAISEIENGRRRVDSLELKRLARLYGYPTSFFLGDDETAENESVIALARLAGEMREADRQEILRFAAYLRHAGRTTH